MLKISGNPEYLPWSWHQGTKLTGASLRIAQEAAMINEIKLDIRYVGPLKRVLALLKNGHLDMAVSLTVTDERISNFIFSDFYAVDEVALIKKRGTHHRYVKWDDLRGRKIATTQGNSWGPDLDDHLDQQSTVFRTSNLNNVLKMVRVGRVDYGLHRYYALLALMDLPENQRDFQMLYNHVNIIFLHFAFSRNSPCKHLVEPFNQALAHLRRSGRVSVIVQEEFERARRSVFLDTPSAR